MGIIAITVMMVMMKVINSSCDEHYDWVYGDDGGDGEDGADDDEGVAVVMVTMVKMARMMTVTKIAPVQKDSGVGVDWICAVLCLLLLTSSGRSWIIITMVMVTTLHLKEAKMMMKICDDYCWSHEFPK